MRDMFGAERRGVLRDKGRGHTLPAVQKIRRLQQGKLVRGNYRGDPQKTKKSTRKKENCSLNLVEGSTQYDPDGKKKKDITKRLSRGVVSI